MMLHMLFFIFGFSNIIFCIIILPFEESLDFNSYENLVYNHLFSEIKIGNLKNKIIIYFTLDSSNIYIPKQFYEKNPSKTLKYLDSNINNYPIKKNNVYGFHSIDTLNINNFELNYSFILVESSEKNLSNTNGIIGLQNNKNTNGNKSLINFFYEKKIINSLILTVKYTSDKKGEIIIGDYPHLYDNNYQEKNLKIISHHDKEYSMKFEDIIFSNKEKEVNINVIFSLELKGIVGSNLYKKFINENFFEYYFLNKKCKIELINNEFYIYICQDIDITKFPSIIFESKILNMNFEMTYKDLFFEKNGIFYFLVYFEKITNFKWILGEIFVKKYQIIIDFQNGIIGFYSSIGKKNKLLFIFILCILIICIFILSALIFKLLFYKIKKIRANELEDYLI